MLGLLYGLLEIAFIPDDIFPSNWIAVGARREKLTVKIFIKRVRDEYPRTIYVANNNSFRRGIKRILPRILIDILKSVRNKCYVIMNNLK